MNNQLAKKMSEYLQAELVGGLVDTISKYSADGKKVTQRFPAYLNEEGKYVDMTPNNRFADIGFFEDYGCKVTGSSKGLECESKLRAILWQNRLKTDVIPSVAAAIIAHRMPNEIKPFEGYSRVIITPTRILTNEADKIFNRYTFEEPVRQFLMHPYGAIGVEFTVTFSYVPQC